MDFNNSNPIAIYNITLKPMRFLMYFTGAIPFEFEHERNCSKLLLTWRLIHMILMAAFIGMISVLRFLRYHEVFYKRSDIFSNGMDMTTYSTLVIIQTIIYIENTWKAYGYKVIFQNFETIRYKFENDLKISMNLSRIRFYSLLLYVLLTIYMIIIGFVIWIRYIKSLNGFRLILTQYGDTILKLKLIEFSIFTTIILSIQMDLNAYVEHYMHDVRRSLIFDRYAKRKLYEKLYVIKDIHNILIMTISSIEESCFWSLPGLILKMFFDFTITAYWIYFSYDLKIPTLFQSYGYSMTILSLFILFVTSSICTKCEKVDKQLSNMINTIKHERFSPYLSACLNEVSLQLYHQKLYFSAGGFVDVNYEFLGKYIFSAVCYIVILIQFHMSI